MVKHLAKFWCGADQILVVVIFQLSKAIGLKGIYVELMEALKTDLKIKAKI